MVYVRSFGSQGSGPSQLKYPRGAAVDRDGNVFVSDITNDRIVKFSASGEGEVFASIEDSYDVAVDGMGRVYIVEYSNHRVSIYDSEGNYITRIGGGASGTQAGSGTNELDEPQSVAIDLNGRIIISDYGYHRVKIYEYPIIDGVEPHELVAQMGLGFKQDLKTLSLIHI